MNLNAGRGGRRRAAFTLLEVILAMAIGAVILYGLYLALFLQMSGMQSGRDMMDEANLSRGVFNNIIADINGNIGPIDSRYIAATTTTTTTTPATTGTTTQTPTATPAGTPLLFNLGVQGGSDTLVLYLSAVPRDALNQLKAGNTATPGPLSDLRRVTYWLIPNKGLARQEVKMVTSQMELDTISGLPGVPGPPAVDDEGKVLLKGTENVTSLAFQYWDGSGWQPEWNGTDPGSDMKTPKGPPLAVEITMTISRSIGNGNTVEQTYRHVVAIPTANNPVPPATDTSGTTAP